MLKKIRRLLAVLCFVAVTLLFLDFTGALHHWLGWAAKVQFFPAVLAANFIIVAVLVLLTLVFGRIYCSVVCPLGVMQDLISWLHGKRKKNRFTYSKEVKWLRYPVLAVFIALVIAGVGATLTLLEPYGTYGMIATNLFQPLYQWCNNGLAAIAEHFTAIAKAQCRLPREAGPFAWLDLDSEEGEMYWRCMEIAGEYSAVCHELIHRNVAQGMRLQPLANVSNHHNFAWRETLTDGSEMIVHRKGATPAHAGELGIIPANMTDAGLLVTGLGCEEALCSASHGAGRAMSRQDARNSFSRYALNRQLAQRGVTLLGGSTEEAPDAYKSIDEVLAASKQLIKVVGRIHPRIVRMNQE